MKTARTILSTLTLPAALIAFAAAPAVAGPQLKVKVLTPTPTLTLTRINPVIRPWLTVAESRDLTFLREEEKLARDVYLALERQWGLSVFGNIASSEQTHMDTVLGLLNTYGLPDPVGGQPEGVFTNTTLQTLYAQLVAQGSQSAEDALRVGATIEDLDISDIEEMEANTVKQDILDVYANLTKGSRNHMRSFSGQLSALGITYVPQFISQEEYDEIIGTDTETGPADSGSGQGSGRGKGPR